jgi:hypothetical protein
MPAHRPFPAFRAPSEPIVSDGSRTSATPSGAGGPAAVNLALIDLVRALARQAAREAWAGAGVPQTQESLP